MRITAAASLILTSALLLASAAPCFAAKGKVGLALPTQNDTRWYYEGPKMKQALEQAGYDAVLFYGGDNDLSIQQRQLPRMVEKEKVNILAVVPIEGDKLADALSQVQKKGVPVISLDRLITKSKAVSYYLGFDNREIGRQQGLAIVDALNLHTAYEPVNVEFFAGDENDNSARYFFAGAQEVLSQYMNTGLVNTPSNQLFFKECAIKDWTAENAMKRMDQLIEKYHYTPDGKGRKLDAVYCANDTLAQGVLQALRKAGFKDDQLPFITGMDAELSALQRIVKGTQGSTIYKDPNTLCAQLVKMVDAVLSGKTPEINDEKTYNNGFGAVKSYLCEPVAITKDNLKEAIVDKGVFSAKDLGL